MFLKLKSSCCGFSLRIGSKTAGSFTLMGGIGVLLVGLFAILRGAVMVDLLTDSSAEIDTIRYVFVAIMSVFVVVGIIKTVVSCLLLRGVDKGDAPMITPWLVYHILEVAMQGIVILLVIGLNFYNGLIGIWFILLLIGLCSITIPVYSLLIVNSYRKELIEVSTAPKM